jgi:hypothetical protein
MAYLGLPRISRNGERFLEGGKIDKVYLVHPISKEQDVDKTWRKILETTPIGYIGILPSGKFLEVIPAKLNPILNEEAKEFLLKNLDTLERFSERSKTFLSIWKRFFNIKL